MAAERVLPGCTTNQVPAEGRDRETARQIQTKKRWRRRRNGTEKETEAETEAEIDTETETETEADLFLVPGVPPPPAERGKERLNHLPFVNARKLYC